MEKVNSELTTSSPLSHYGIPVLRIDGKDFGPRDVVATYTDLLHDPIVDREMTAAQFVCLNSFPAHIFFTSFDAAEKFCAQWPEGPQPRAVVFAEMGI